MSASDRDNFRNNFGIGSSQEANSPQELVAQIKLEREALLQIEANQSTVIRIAETDRQTELAAREIWRQRINCHAIV